MSTTERTPSPSPAGTKALGAVPRRHKQPGPTRHKELKEIDTIRRSPLASVALHATLFLAVCCALFPIVFIIANSFTPENDILRPIETGGSAWDRIRGVIDKAWPDSWGYLDHYREVIGGNFSKWFMNSVIVALATTALGILLAATAGYALSRYKFPGNRGVLYLFLVTQMFPGIILIVPLYNILQRVPLRGMLLLPALIALAAGLAIIVRALKRQQWYAGVGYVVGGSVGAALGALLAFTPLFWLMVLAAVGIVVAGRIRSTDPRLTAAKAAFGSFIGFGLVAYSLLSAPTGLRLLDTRWGLILAYCTIAVPFCTWMLKGYFDTIPVELEQAAQVDGLTPFGTFWKIAMPLALPGIAVTAFYSFITAWNEFMYAFTFNSSTEKYTLPVGLQTYVSQFRTEWGQFSAGAILVSIPALLFFFIAQRWLVGGLTAGATKA